MTTMVETDAPFIGWDWDIVHDADLRQSIGPLYYNGNPINLTGCSLDLHIRPTWGYSPPIAILTSPTNITIDDALLALVTVAVPKTTVDDWPLGEWEFFMRVIDGTGKIYEVARGPFRIHPGNIAAS
jgi:hypothetical protein